MNVMFCPYNKTVSAVSILPGWLVHNLFCRMVHRSKSISTTNCTDLATEMPCLQFTLYNLSMCKVIKILILCIITLLLIFNKHKWLKLSC